MIPISEVKDGDAVSSIEFRCVCDRYKETLHLSDGKKIDGTLLTDVCEKQCDRCGEYSGFNFTVTGRKQRPEDCVTRKQQQELLREILNSDDLKRPAKNTRDMIATVLEGTNLRALFAVERSTAAKSA